MEPKRVGAYALIRNAALKDFIIRESFSPEVPETILLTLWMYQRLDRQSLITLDGRRLRVLHPGFLSIGAGPDFQNAVIQFEQDAPVQGDVEIDVSSACWRLHGHGKNPRYQRVILRVVWEAKRVEVGEVPILELKGKTDSPLTELIWWYGRFDPRAVPPNSLGKCASVFRRMNDDQLQEFFSDAGAFRLNVKTARICSRAGLVGWEQCLWENLFQSLGYKNNVWPMLRLGELRPYLPGPEAGAEVLGAVLFGISGLLPRELPKNARGSAEYVQRMWQIWWRCQLEYHQFVLPPSLWNFSGVRPANHPHRRLALAALWLANPEFVSRLEQWLLDPGENPRSSLESILVPSAGAYWERHFNLFSGPTAINSRLLGMHRITDIAINVILPWFRAKGLATGNKHFLSTAEKLFFEWPAGQDNSVLQCARMRFFGVRRRLSWERTASIQQGMIQVFRDFCCQDNPLCVGCHIFDELRTRYGYRFVEAL